METWKDIKGFEGYYQVSDLGRVKSLKRKVPNQHFLMTVKERIKSSRISSMGYANLVLYKNSKPTVMSVHRIVAESFIENPKSKPFVNHIDGNKFNNKADNLEWVTPKENDEHAWRIGLKSKSLYQGEKCSGSKLKKSDVLEIRNMCKLPNANLTRISEKYKVDPSTISDIKRRKSWKHI